MRVCEINKIRNITPSFAKERSDADKRHEFSKNNASTVHRLYNYEQLISKQVCAMITTLKHFMPSASAAVHGIKCFNVSEI